MAFEQLEPFESTRGDYRQAAISTLLANINRDPKKRSEPFKIQDFLLRFDGEAKESKQKISRAEDQIKVLMLFAEALTTPGKGPADHVG